MKNIKDSDILLAAAVNNLLALASDPAGSSYTLREVFGLYGHASPQPEGVKLIAAAAIATVETNTEHKALLAVAEAAQGLADEVRRIRMNVRKDFSLMNAHACTDKALHTLADSRLVWLRTQLLKALSMFGPLNAAQLVEKLAMREIVTNEAEVTKEMEAYIASRPGYFLKDSNRATGFSVPTYKHNTK